MEECPSHIRTVVGEARHEWAGTFSPTRSENIPSFLKIEHISSDTTKLAECEFYVIEEMSAFMIIHHPYRTLQHVSSLLGLAQSDIVAAWTIINDTYASDIPLLYPPHIIALSAMYMAYYTPSQLRMVGKSASVLTSQKLVEWYASSGVDMDAIAEVTQEILSLYSVWQDYKAGTCKSWMDRIMSGRSVENNGNGKFGM
jgi:cyclin-C